MRMITINIKLYDANYLHSNHHLAYQSTRRDHHWSRRDYARGSPIHLWIEPDGIHLPQEEPLGINPRGSFPIPIIHKSERSQSNTANIPIC
jgi:hypothetical protein